jgi:WD40 repeat protein
MLRVVPLLLAPAALALTLAGPARAQPTNTTEITALAFTPDGKTVVAASLDGTLRLWDVAGKKETQQVAAHKGGVYGGALSPDGKRFATAGADG